MIYRFIYENVSSKRAKTGKVPTIGKERRLYVTDVVWHEKL